MLEERDEINNALSKHFSSICVDSTLESNSKERILNVMKEKDELSRTDENTLSILFTKESISNTLMKLKSGKAPGIDEIPND
jgi:tellurite resistance protein